MTSYADLKAKYDECNARREAYWQSVEQKVVEIAKGFPVYLNPEGEVFLGRDGKRYNYVVAGAAEFGKFKTAHIDDLETDGACLRLAFLVRFPNKDGSRVEEVLVEVGVGRDTGKFFALVDSDTKKLKVEISSETAEKDTVLLYETLAGEVARQIEAIAHE